MFVLHHSTRISKHSTIKLHVIVVTCQSIVEGGNGVQDPLLFDILSRHRHQTRKTINSQDSQMVTHFSTN